MHGNIRYREFVIHHAQGFLTVAFVVHQRVHWSCLWSYFLLFGMLAAEQGIQTSERAALHAHVSPLLRGRKAEEGTGAVSAEPAG